ncbi:hypothetical protein ATI61_102484 [Archangium gephyra]|uniref:Uncharacterized protein n=1 Tax=Archangium gephyra TaxID=48 RepID=A0AAC8TGN9_9BACT|nr:hypothetical protein [Archangium gephyra]AKJ05427.1 Hypothetical protein AA314_07053 [Archangium gephyra]REG36110.1 hypothetical protein ATI61_102484 [Archangium gephyra]
MSMDDKVNELLEILRRLLRESKRQVDEEVLREIVSLVIKNPLADDRKACQDQIFSLLSERVGGTTDAD